MRKLLIPSRELLKLNSTPKEEEKKNFPEENRTDVEIERTIQNDKIQCEEHIIGIMKQNEEIKQK